MKKLLLLSLLVLFSSCEKDPIQYSLSISPNPPIGGYVNPRTGTYNAGETVSILASPNQFYGFKNWSGGWNGTSPSVTITMDGDKNIIGNFEKIDIDEDGVLNENDLCGGTPSGLTVDGSGCAASQKDTDGDGVSDNLDQCENTPSDAQIVTSSGCSTPVSSLSSNGITIVASANAQIGMTEIIDGNTYTVVSEQQLREMIDDNEDIFYVITSKITNMELLFYEKEINGNVSH